MYDISELQPTGKEIAVLILAVFIFMVVVFGSGYCVGLWHGNHISDNGTGIESVGKELEQAGTNISDAKAGIEAAAGHADKVSSGIESAKESAEYIHSTANTSGELISECKSIIAGVRARGQAAKTQD